MKVKTTEKPLPAIGSACDPRSPGLHISTIINDMAKRLGYINESDWEMMTTWGVGLLFEIALEIALGGDLAPRLGELQAEYIYHCKDCHHVWEEHPFSGKCPECGSENIEDLPIFLTPDGYDPLWGRVHEYKCTWKSVNNNIVELNWMFMAQTMAYCRVVGTKEVKFHILYLMGDYRGSGPKYLEVEIEFTDLEIEENWQVLLKHAAFMKEEGLC